MIELHDVCKTYGQGDNQVSALSHLDLTLARGQFVSITCCVQDRAPEVTEAEFSEQRLAQGV